MVQKRPVPGSSAPSLAKSPFLESGKEAHPSGKMSAAGSVSNSSADTRKKGVHGGDVVLCLLIIFICSFSGWYAFQIF